MTPPDLVECGMSEPYSMDFSVVSFSNKVVYPYPSDQASTCIGFDNCLEAKIDRSAKASFVMSIVGKTIAG
jgi:hypothetical protein